MMIPIRTHRPRTFHIMIPMAKASSCLSNPVKLEAFYVVSSARECNRLAQLAQECSDFASTSRQLLLRPHFPGYSKRGFSMLSKFVGRVSLVDHND